MNTEKKALKPPADMVAGTVHSSNNYGDFEIVEYRGALDVGIRFMATGHTKSASAGSIRIGRIRDPYSPVIYGVGFIGEGCHASWLNRKRAPACQTWTNMLERCYSKVEDQRYPAYAECTVADEWLNFQVFAEWYEQHYVEGFDIDKDILIKGNKCYSPAACCFVTHELNCLLNDGGSKRGLLQRGVRRNGKKFSAHAAAKGRQAYLGTFNTAEQAHTAYCRAKAAEIIRHANLPTTPAKLVEPLLSRANDLINSIESVQLDMWEVAA